MTTLAHVEMAELCRLFRARQMVRDRWTHAAHLVVATDIVFELGRERGMGMCRRTSSETSWRSPK